MRSGEYQHSRAVFLLMALLFVVVILSLLILIFPALRERNLFSRETMPALLYFCALGLGLLISTVAKNSNQSQQIVMMMMFIGIVLGGYLFPRDTMPRVLQWMGNLFPLTYFIPIARGIITKGIGINMLWGPAIGLFVHSVVTMILAARTFRQGLD